MTETVKGFQDFTGEQAVKRAEIKKILAKAFEQYGFEPAETPVIEYEEFVRGENQQDEVISDIFKLKDKGKRKLALRYEFTFQLKRLMKNKKLPYKRYQIGEVFRDEPVSANRFRQFTQCDADIVGSTIKDETEILALVKDILNELGIKPVIYFNNRKLLAEVLSELNVKDKKQVLREIDKLDKLAESEVRVNLKKLKADKILTVLKKPESYFKKYKSYSKIEELKRYCKYYGIEIKFQPSLARGLSYYNGNVFEVKVKGMKETICAGGSYMFNNVQSTGISFGLERLSNLSKIKLNREKILIWPNGKDKEAIDIAKKLREQEKICEIIYKTNMKKVFDYANSEGFSKIIFYDKKRNKFVEKNMKSGKEK